MVDENLWAAAKPAQASNAVWSMVRTYSTRYNSSEPCMAIFMDPKKTGDSGIAAFSMLVPEVDASSTAACTSTTARRVMCYLATQRVALFIVSRSSTRLHFPSSGAKYMLQQCCRAVSRFVWYRTRSSPACTNTTYAFRRRRPASRRDRSIHSSTTSTQRHTPNASSSRCRKQLLRTKYYVGMQLEYLHLPSLLRVHAFHLPSHFIVILPSPTGISYAISCPS